MPNAEVFTLLQCLNPESQLCCWDIFFLITATHNLPKVGTLNQVVNHFTRLTSQVIHKHHNHFKVSFTYEKDTD